MLSKKRGFTLVELLVVIAISAIVLAMVGTSMVFITKTTGDLIQEAENIDMAKNIEKYLRGLLNDKDRSITCEQLITANTDDSIANDIFKIKNGNLIEDEKVIFSDTGLTQFKIEQEGDFIVCEMQFDSGKEFKFTLGIAQTTQQEVN